MFTLNSRKFKAIVMLACVGLLAGGLVARTASPVLARPQAASKTSRLAYHDEWRKLWEDHITWTRVVIMGILNDLPGTDEYIGRLLLNYEEMEDALAPYYGDEAEVLGELIEDHLVIAAELLTAAHNNDTAGFEDARVRWYENASQIAVQMNLMNPKYWPLEETRQMWFDHLDATLEEATAHLTGDFAAEVAAYDLVHDLALEMADFMSMGVIRQFPQKFTGGSL
jgi:hypothetical protein